METVYQTLAAARPTAVDPVNAMNDVRRTMLTGETVAEKTISGAGRAEEFANEGVRFCEEIGRHGSRLIRDGMNILTHCNAGWLAFVDVGTATAPMYAAQSQGKKFHVLCDENPAAFARGQPDGMGVVQQKISHLIIADNAAAI